MSFTFPGRILFITTKTLKKNIVYTKGSSSCAYRFTFKKHFPRVVYYKHIVTYYLYKVTYGIALYVMYIYISNTVNTTTTCLGYMALLVILYAILHVLVTSCA